MRVSIVRPEQSALVRAIRRHRAAEQAREGVHCSDIIRDIVQHTDPKQGDGIPEHTGLVFQEIGNGVEDVIAAAIRDRYGAEKPAPRRYRGIICSPDGDDGMTIHEMKARWGSCRGFIELDDEAPTLLDPMTGLLTGESWQFTKYKMQLLFYMKAFGRRFGQLHVLFLSGDFRPPFPRPVTLRLRPTEDELDDNAELLVQHAIDMGVLTPKEARI